MNTKINILCKQHGVFNKSPSSFIHQISGCPKCRVTNGERVIMNYLEQNNIEYIFQYKHASCINPLTNYRLIFDFFLPKSNIIIEFDGIQHFEDTHGQLPIIQGRDEVKNKWCKDNNITLIRISYKDIKNIPLMLDELKILRCIV